MGLSSCIASVILESDGPTSEVCNRAFHLPAAPLQSNVNLLGFHGTEGVGSDRPAHLSFARGRSAGHAVYASRRQSSRSGAVSEESKRRFGGALEPLTYVRAFYEDRERQELARLDSCEVLESPLATEVSYPRAVALGHVAELLDELLPDREANDAVFRLALSVMRDCAAPMSGCR